MQGLPVFVLSLHYIEQLITKTVQMIFSQGTQLHMGNSFNVLCHELALSLYKSYCIILAI